MKRIILLYFCIILIPAFSVEKKALFIPRDDLPFHQFSAKGDFSILPSDELWPEVLQIVSSGDGSNVQIVAQNLPEFSLKDLNQVLWLKVENLKELKDLWFYASDSSDFSNRIVFMVSQDPSQLREGEWCRVSLPLSSGQIWGNPDLSKLTSYQIWMNDRGGSPVTLQMGPVFLEESLPPSALVFSFDDGWKTQISAAAPLMSQYGLKGTAYIIPALIGTPGYMDLDDLKRLINDYGWSVGSHYLEPINNFDSAEVRSLFEKQRQWFENAGISMNDFSYPNGMHDQELLTIVPDYFRTGRTIIEFPESLPPGNPYKLRMLNVIPSTSLDVIENRIQTMADRGELLILVFHKIESVSQFETELTVERFEEICRIAARSGRENLNMESVYPRF
ncbi:polysaccharide deacetylase family protein, partial [Oceanispirochaeta sp.]|uniref:polysaccharide deacetylase family protein n=1 Tax=Oceanispirochaeta sp. TaxID=2035350 RepID=UPI002617BAF5